MRTTKSLIIVLAVVTPCVGWSTRCLAQPSRAGSKDAEAHFNRGVEQLGKGEHDAAIASFSEAIRLNPKHAEAYHNRGVATLKKAVDDFKQAIRLYPQRKLNYRWMKTFDRASDELMEVEDKRMDELMDAEEARFERQMKQLEAAVENEIKQHDEKMEQLDLEDERETKELQRARKELEAVTKELAFKPGAEVVTLRDIELKAGRETVGTVRRGERLVVEQVQGKWLWVRRGQTRGWIDSRSVMDAVLFAWYRRLPELESVTVSATTRAKFAGVLFQITNAGTGPAVVGNSQGNIYGLPSRGPFLNASYSKARILLERVGRRETRLLWIKFDPLGGGGISIPPPPGWTTGSSYGLVQPGDFVLIDPPREVFVNGVQRQPRR